MFTKIGIAIDVWIDSLQQWWRVTWIYKFYMYFGIAICIKCGLFKREEHFEYSMMWAGREQLYRWQFNSLAKMYYKGDNDLFARAEKEWSEKYGGL